MSKKKITLNVEVEFDLDDSVKEKDFTKVVNELGIDITFQSSPDVVIMSSNLIGWSVDVALTPVKCPIKEQLKKYGALNKVGKLANLVKVGDTVIVRKLFTIKLADFDDIVCPEDMSAIVEKKNELIELKLETGHEVSFDYDGFNLYFKSKE